MKRAAEYLFQLANEQVEYFGGQPAVIIGAAGKRDVLDSATDMEKAVRMLEMWSKNVNVVASPAALQPDGSFSTTSSGISFSELEEVTRPPFRHFWYFIVTILSAVFMFVFGFFFQLLAGGKDEKAETHEPYVRFYDYGDDDDYDEDYDDDYDDEF